MTAAPEQPLVIVLDDDQTVREALENLIQSTGMETACFASAQDLFEAGVLARPGCLILDVRMPGASGLDLQRRLAAAGNPKPIIFLTGHGDIPMTVEAMKAGAVDFLTKPFREQTLLDAIVVGIETDRARRARAETVKRHVERLETLTWREHEVLAQVALGRLNKQIAYDLGISEVTVKLHRSNAMRKMEVSSIGDLIRAWEMLPDRLRHARARDGDGRGDRPAPGVAVGQRVRPADLVPLG